MFRRIARVVLFSFLALAIFVFLFATPIVDRTQNKTRQKSPYTVSAHTLELHHKLFVADLHADALLWKRNLLEKSNRGHVDVPRLIEGNVALQTFTVVTKSPWGLNIERNSDKTDSITTLAIVSLWPIRTWTSLKQRALYQAERLRSFSTKSNGKFSLIQNRNDLLRYVELRKSNSQITAGFLGMEGAHPIEGDLQNLDDFYNAGYRMIAPVHFFDNEIGGSAHGLGKGGLTSLGMQMVRRMEDKKMIVDLAHGSTALISDVLSIAKRPVIVSHTGVRGTCDNQRNLSDSQLRAIAANGGLIGIGFWDTAICGSDTAAVARAIKYASTVAGIDHVALGSDFDGAVTVPFDSTGMPLLTEALIKEGFTPDQIRKIMGENALTFLLRNLP